MPNISFAGAKKRKTRHLGYVFRMTRPELSVTPLAPATHGLCALVDELLLNIIDYINTQDALCCFAATNSRFRGLVEPYVWRKLLVLAGHHARRIAVALDSWDTRVNHVQELSIRYKDEEREGIEDLNHAIGLMGKLRHLTIESPCPNNTEWRQGVYFDSWSRIDYSNLLAAAVYPRRGLEPALPMLKSLTLHAHGSGDRKFVLGRAVAMFLHPTLQKIELSCLNFDGDLDVFGENDIHTPLRSLTLIECNVSVIFLDAVLSYPKALGELSIGERLHIFPECEPSTDPVKRTSSAVFLTALQRQAHSLQKLSHIGGQIAHLLPRQDHHEGSAKLRSFINLKHLELGFESDLYYYLRQNGFPPALKTLRMHDSAISINAGRNLLSTPTVAYNSLLSLVQDHIPSSLQPGFILQYMILDRFHFTPNSIQQQRLLSLFLKRPSIYQIVSVLKSYGAEFRIARDTFPSGNTYIPPYMYGEELPVLKEMYNSEDYWRFNGINYRMLDDDNLRDEMKKAKALKVCKKCRERGWECRNLGNGTSCEECGPTPGSCFWEEEEGEVAAS